MRDLGRDARRIREFLDLSQERLAKTAGVSEGAVSCLEAGRGTATPFLVVAKVRGALVIALREVDPATVPEDMRQMLDAERFFAPSQGTAKGEAAAASVPTDPALDDLIRRYRHMTKQERLTFLTFVRVALGALSRTN
jgi:transcriptional regulator with XRE-family HTH domain